MRMITLDGEFALLLAGLRLAAERRAVGICGGNWGREPTPGRVRLQDIERVEEEFGLRLPDPIVAYLAAGVSAWGDGPISVAAIPDRTRDILAMQRDADDDSGTPFVVIDDDSNGNYIAIRKSDNRNDDTVCFLDHEDGYSVASGFSLAEHIENILRDGGIRASEAFAVVVYDEPDPVPDTRWVEHTKFGRGEVLDEAGDIVTVMFESAGKKRLKRNFLTFL